ncbi:EcpB family pilus assembly chaperone [Aeromonas hydrophila]|uniref:EcpB family pilus assembly chaperone n=1 Tax=Aeromonas hydrophila TaxID=644 RepID=UPI0013032C6A|nr:fimbria/pilus periplasmic chaperone [Aeromonas hydrophila]QGZ71101.1 fimbria/pilus periplasmic chaperone [Aeromonas hydrophila]
MLTRQLCLMLTLFPLASNAINVGPITTFIDTGFNEVAREIENDTEQARLVTVSVTRISSPEEGGNEMATDVNGELLLSPSRLVLPAKGKNNVRFFYKGQADDKERYYRVTWRDTPLSLDEHREEGRQATATTSAQIGTILVVAPRQVRFNYVFRNSTLTNTGNASYRVVAYGVCANNPTEQCKENYYDLPGKERRFSRVDIVNDKSHIGLWFGKEFVVVK